MEESGKKREDMAIIRSTPLRWKINLY